MNDITLAEAAEVIRECIEAVRQSVPAPTQPTGHDTVDALRGLIGQHVLIRTVTVYHVGRLIGVDARTLVLGDASWVADVGRFGAALASGALNEVERFADDVYVARGAVVDVTRWAHPLPAASK